jgi:hypothetical protein
MLTGSMVLEDRYPYLPPFLKHLHHLVNSKVTLAELKARVLKLDWDCISVDPTHIVDEYQNPWWIDPTPDAMLIDPFEGFPDFLRRV